MTAQSTVAVLNEMIAAKEAHHREAVETRARKREELRELDRTVQKLETQLGALRELLNEAAPQTGPGTVSSIGVVASDERALHGSLAGLPRTQAIEIILAEAGPRELHRREILEQLRQRGFPGERLGDTSAALAYLKRSGRARNPVRGYWQVA